MHAMILEPWSIALSVAYAGSFGLLGFLLKKWLAHYQPAPFPPGPKGLPLIGNVLDWPKDKEGEIFTQWAERYGDIIYCDLVGQPVIILNSARLAIEMLDRKGAKYSSRPSMYVGCELVGWKKSPPMAPYGEYLRKMRQMINKEIGTKAAVDRYAPMTTREVQKFLRRILDAPSSDLLFAHIRKLATSIVLNASHGYAVREGDDPVVDVAERAMHNAEELLMPGAFLVDVFPILDRLPSWFPGTGFRQVAAEALALSREFHDLPYEWVKEELARGTAQPSFVAAQLEGKDLSVDEEDAVKYAAGAFYGAGTEASFSLIAMFLLAMTLHPNIQTRARAEIDLVVGTDRLPSMAHRGQLPYLDAVCKEVLRWAPPTPVGIPRASTEDDIHDGYFIPKGAYVLANIWKFTHDPETYRDPMAFDPSRFYSEAGREPEQDPRDYVFGFGRRICPGSLMFGSTFFITCAMTLAVLDIGKQVDDNGLTVEPEVAFKRGLLHCPLPFRCSIRPRSPKAAALVRESEEAHTW